MADTSSVRVAIRVRPQNPREMAAGYQICTMVSRKDAQIFIGNDKVFAYDFVFDRECLQEEVYGDCIRDLVDGVFKGFNATILAYGQTGSGKTHTMGTAFDAAAATPESELAGVIPRAAQQLFLGFEQKIKEASDNGDPTPAFNVDVQFIELYNEDLIDLLSPDRSHNIKIHEDRESGQIILQNASSVTASSPMNILEILRNGALNRKVASTNMNKESSRSHAIFSVHVKQDCIETIKTEDGEEKLASVISAKLHFVDLAGSERLKRTGATGERAKEGISINCGLLALGNVINALTGPKKGHVPYRDSKLTRLLQDSLGGNSRTLMIACASPNDVDFAETLNTLNYAARTKAIKNKVVANKDHGSAMVGQLRAKINALEAELNEYRQGKRVAGAAGEGEEVLSDQYYENVHLQREVQRLTVRASALQDANNALTERATRMKEELEKEKLMKLIPKSDSDGNLSPTEQSDFEAALSKIVDSYVAEIEQLKSQMSEEICEKEQYKKKYEQLKRRAMDGEFAQGVLDTTPFSPMIENPLITSARKEIEDQKKMLEIYKEQNDKKMGSSTATVEDSEAADEDVEMELASTPEDESEIDEMDAELAEGEKNHARLVMEVADLQTEISTKEKLIMELEQTERRLAQVRRDYERKLNELSDRISATEAERDRILMEMTQKPSTKLSEAKVKEVQRDYERRISTMKGEFSKLKMAQKEHERLRQRQMQQQAELQRTRNELQQMKTGKVKLVQQMREEAKKVKRAEMEAAKKIAAMEKANRIKENKLRTLETKDRQREEFLRRKMEQYSQLQQKQRTPMAGVAASQRARFGLMNKKTFSPVVAKNKWRKLEQKMNAMVSEHTGMTKLDEQHVRLLNEKVQVEQKIAELDTKFIKAKSTEDRGLVQEDLASAYEHLKYVDDQIKEVRAAIADLECSNKENDEDRADAQTSMQAIIQQCENLHEARYLLEQLMRYGISSKAELEKCQNKIKELEARVLESENNNAENERYVNDLIMSQTRGPMDLERDLFELDGETPKRLAASRQSLKARRRTQTTKELLYAQNGTQMDTTFCVPNKNGAELRRGLQDLTIHEEADSPHSAASSSPDQQETAEAQPNTQIRNVGLFSKHIKAVQSVDLTDTHAISVGKERVFWYWDLERCESIMCLRNFPKPCGPALFHPFDENLIFCAASFTIQVWDARTNMIASHMNSSGIAGNGGFVIPGAPPRSEHYIAPICLSPCGNYMSTCHDQDVRIWDVRKQQALTLCPKVNANRSVVDMAMAVGPRFCQVYAGDSEGNIIAVEVDNQFSHVQTLNEPIDLHPQMQGRVIQLEATQKSLYGISKNGNLWRFSNVDLTRERVVSDAHDGKPMGSMAIMKHNNTDYDLIATADRQGCIRLWTTENTNSFKVLDERFAAHSGSINGMACNRRGILATASSDETVKLWQPAL